MRTILTSLIVRLDRSVRDDRLPLGKDPLSMNLSNVSYQLPIGDWVSISDKTSHRSPD